MGELHGIERYLNLPSVNELIRLLKSGRFEKLTNAPEKRMTVIGSGTHTLLLENHRHELHDVVSGFLK